MMRISERKKVELYKSISGPITDLRILTKEHGSDLDSALFQLEIDIWRRVHETLKLDGIP